MSDSENPGGAAAETGAPGAGTVISGGSKEVLEQKLAKAAVMLAGTEALNPVLAAQVTELMDGGATTPNTKSLITAVLSYMRETGANSNLTAEDGARKHVALYRDIQMYLNKAPLDFRKGFSMLLRIISDQKKKDGVFSPRFMFRFVSAMKMANNDRVALELLFQALADLSSPDSRATALAQVDLAKVGSLSLMPEGAQRLTGFFVN